MKVSVYYHFVVYPVNWIAGWALILASFLTGAGIGLLFHRPQFWGGYASFPRRCARLGHVALAAICMLNLLFALSPVPVAPVPGAIASAGLVLGGVAMPAVCFLTAWRRGARRLFALPVALLVLAVAAILIGAIP